MIVQIPIVLVVINCRLIFELNADESLMIVGGAVNKVTQDLFFAPFSRSRASVKFFIRDFAD